MSFTIMLLVFVYNVLNNVYANSDTVSNDWTITLIYGDVFKCIPHCAELSVAKGLP